MAFTYDDFRATEGLRAELAAFLTSDIGRIAIRALRARYTPYDVPNDADALVSARILSQFHGAHTVLDDIEAMATPLATGMPVEATFEASDTDHNRLPGEDELRPQVRAPAFSPPQEE